MFDAVTVQTSPTRSALPPVTQSAVQRRVAGALKAHAGTLAVLIFAFVFLSPLLRSGFYFDDMINSVTAGLVGLGDESLQTYIDDHTAAWMENGRFFPLAVSLTYALHAVLFNALPYKGLLLALILSNVVEFYYLLRCWKVPTTTARLGTLSLVLLLQMRMFPDPLLSHAGVLQLVAGQLLISMICLQKYLDSRRLGWLLGSAAAYGTSLVTYEISYFFLPIYLAMAYAHFHGWKAMLAATSPHWAVALCLAAFVLGLRFHIVMPEDHPYRIHLSAGEIVGVIYRQSSAGLPLSYALMSPYRQEFLSFKDIVSRWENWAMFFAAGTLTWILARNFSQDLASQEGPRRRLLWTLGGMVGILPGLPLAFSSKYQQWIHFPGVGYLPVYIQYFGVALLVIAGLLWLGNMIPRCRRQLALALIGANACVAMIQFDTNRNVVERMQASVDGRRRVNLEAALSAGVADKIPDGATIMTIKWRPWLFDGPPSSSALFTQWIGRRVHVVNRDPGPHKQRPLTRQLEKLNPPSFVAIEGSLDGDSDYVLMGSLESTDARVAGSESNTQGTRAFRLFVRGPLASAADSRAQAWLTSLSLQATSAVDRLDAKRLEPQRIRLSQLTKVQAGSDWAIYDGSFTRVAELTSVSLVLGLQAADPTTSPVRGSVDSAVLSSSLAKERP